MSESLIHPANGRIIFVDKDVSMREMMEMLLHTEQHEIVTVRSAEEGLSLMEAHEKYDIVISSFILPGMNGLEFLYQVSVNHPETVRILMTSGCGDMVDVNDALAKGNVSRLAIKPLCLSNMREQMKNDIASVRAIDAFSAS